MAVDATGTPTSPDNIPKFDTTADAPSGKGGNAQVDALQTIITQLKAGTLPSGKIAFAGVADMAGPTLLYPAVPGTLSSSTNAGGANNAWLAPITITVPTTITRFSTYIGTQAGNIDVGIYYSDDDATFTKLVSSGSTAVGTGGAVQTITVASTLMTPVVGRRWYSAIALSSATAVISAYTLGTANLNIGAFTKTSSFPLPATLTSMNVGNATHFYTVVRV